MLRANAELPAVKRGGWEPNYRERPGVVGIDHGAKYDPIVPGELDRFLLVPRRP